MTPEELAQQDEDDLAWAMSQPQGRRFVRRIFERWGRLEERSETGEQSTTAFNEGMREVGRCLKTAALKASPGNFRKLVLEGLDALEPHRIHPSPEASE